MRKSSIAIILLIVLAAVAIPTVIATDQQNHISITYGETTYHNQEYKNIVDNYFKNSGADFNKANVSVISASDVNKVASGISHNTYNSNQIFSSALVDLTSKNDLKVEVDTSKITTITPSMYQSALESAGITKGHVVVTSPVSATGESALAGVMNSYEKATNVSVPTDVQAAANNEIVTEAKIVNESNVDPENLSKVVDKVKDQVISQNITNHNEIKSIVTEVSNDTNVNLSSSDVESITNSVQQTQSVQDSANAYKEKLSNSLDNDKSIFDQILEFFGF